MRRKYTFQGVPNIGPARTYGTLFFFQYVNCRYTSEINLAVLMTTREMNNNSKIANASIIGKACERNDCRLVVRKYKGNCLKKPFYKETEQEERVKNVTSTTADKRIFTSDFQIIDIFFLIPCPDRNFFKIGIDLNFMKLQIRKSINSIIRSEGIHL